MKTHSLVSTADILAFPIDLDMAEASCVLGVICHAVSNWFPSLGPSSYSICTRDSLYSSLAPSSYYEIEE